MSPPSIIIGRHQVGPGHPVYFIAEAGSNHDGSLDQAKRLIDVAADAGADAVKFQTFRADTLYARGAGRSAYLKASRSINDIIRDLEMPVEWISQLDAHCKERGVDFLSTPFDELSADLLAPYVPAFKIASYEMTHYPLVQYVARKGKPLIISTGTARMDEVAEMVAAVRAVGDPGLVVLQCTAKYPSPLTALNVRALNRFSELGVLTGFSDHSREVLPGPLAAVALGASVIEKHFTLSNSLPGPDHAYALEPSELGDLIKKVRQVESVLGSGEKVTQPEERELRAFARRTIFTTHALPAGQRLGRADLAVLRCGTLPYGLHPKHYLRLLGCHTRRALPAEATPLLEDVSPLEVSDGDLTIRPLARDDGGHVVQWRSRPEIATQMFSDTPPTQADHDRWFEDLQLRTDRVDFVIVEAGLGRVGTVTLSQIDWAKNRAEYGILIGEPPARGRGLALRASALILRYGFHTLGLEEVWLRMFSDNEPAHRLYRRLGFSGPSSTSSHRMKDGASRSVVEMSITRSSWIDKEPKETLP